MLPKLQYAICLIVYLRSKRCFFPHYHLRQASSHFSVYLCPTLYLLLHICAGVCVFAISYSYYTIEEKYFTT